MKITDIINNSFKNIIRNKKYLFIFIANIICLCIFIVTLLISTTYKNKIYNGLENNPLANTISIDLDTKKNGEKYSSEELNKILDKVNNINHVVDTFHQKYGWDGAIINEEKDESVVLWTLVNGFVLPDATYTKDLKLNEIIIPKKFYKKWYTNYDEVIEEEIIDGDTLIGKEIPVFWEVLDCVKEEYVDKNELTLKVVGTYDSAKTGVRMFYSFANVDTIKQIVDNSKINITADYEVSDFYYVQVDNVKNVNAVKRKLKNMGLSPDWGIMWVNSEYYNKYVYLMETISIISFIFLVLFKMLFIRKMVNDNRKVMFINILNGYKKKDIVLEESLKNILIDFISLLIISIILVFGIKYYNKNCINLVMDGLIPRYPIISMIVTFIWLIIIEFFFTRRIINKKLKDNLTTLIRED